MPTGVTWDGTSSGSFTAAYFYEYDVANRLTSMASFADASEAAYSYDDRNQLTGVTYSDLPGISAITGVSLPTNETYAFDSTGNREVSGTTSSASGTHNRVQNDGTYTYTYDNEGNQLTKTEISSGDVTTYEYDHRNRLVKVSTTTKVVTYQYDALDQRTGKHVDEGANGSIDRSEAWVWNGGHAVMRFEDADGDGSQPFELTNHYLYGSMVDMLLAEDLVGSSSGPSDGILWPLADHLGSVRDIVNSDGVRREHRVYDSFGNVTSETDYDDYYGSLISSTASDAVDSAIGYTGREWDDDVDLQYNRARWYDPAQGRWISQDPIGFNAGDANLYRYVGNQATRYTDPSGLQSPASGTMPVFPVQITFDPKTRLYQLTKAQVSSRALAAGGMAAGILVRQQYMVANALSKRNFAIASQLKNAVECGRIGLEDAQAIAAKLQALSMSAVNYNATTVPGALWNTLTGQTTTQDALTNSANSIAARVEIEIALSLGVTLHWPSKPHTNKTPGHWETIKDKVRELVDSGDYDEIWVNKGLGQVKPGIKPNRRPDIFGRRKKDGKIDQFEVPSKTDDPKDLLERMRDSAKKLGPDAGDCELVPLNSP